VAIVQSSDANRAEFVDAINRLCGEANEAINLASKVFPEDKLPLVRRELARIMEISEAKILALLPDEAGLENGREGE
jgi:hypothetical protein